MTDTPKRLITQLKKYQDVKRVIVPGLIFPSDLDNDRMNSVVARARQAAAWRVSRPQMSTNDDHPYRVTTDTRVKLALVYPSAICDFIRRRFRDRRELWSNAEDLLPLTGELFHRVGFEVCPNLLERLGVREELADVAGGKVSHWKTSNLRASGGVDGVRLRRQSDDQGFKRDSKAIDGMMQGMIGRKYRQRMSFDTQQAERTLARPNGTACWEQAMSRNDPPTYFSSSDFDGDALSVQSPF